ncbi:polar amino acid transport system substrate-binding protein [Pseudomonas cuatrocienegasensis]|uniref:Polar amino acid transport system substrate-binding protein n=1 Tax=Pseudomonas cuatrocienegasensis TaxID=543360 RepID=A0ABY1BKW3_9PSED|nr:MULTISPECIES: transporter substrate-binding domain-containing protein [Pseudomonas]SER06860.1 polar amino acid transport system substrate-binding protein [Pseudomonas cuatrocienegasensis]
MRSIRLVPLMLVLLSPMVFAARTLELFMPDAPPLTFLNFHKGYGMVGDVTLAAIARANHPVVLQVAPWARAQKQVSEGRDLLIIPLSRTPERESLYTWIVPIMPLERAFFSLDTPVRDFAEARQRYQRIAVGLGTAQLEILKNEGFQPEQIVALELGDKPMRMLELGRVDAWFTGVPEGLYGQLAPDAPVLQMSAPLASTPLYLACSLDCDPALVKRLREAVESLLAEGTAQRMGEAYLPSR